jgi:hypothetical protein
MNALLRAFMEAHKFELSDGIAWYHSWVVFGPVRHYFGLQRVNVAPDSLPMAPNVV